MEISDFANEILRHGDFAIYPVEPVLRHGTTVQKEAFADEAALLAAGVQKIKAWQEQGYETIAVVCRDEAEAAATARKLKKYVPVVEEDLETAEFGEGVMVLPVAYTKGLEFDAVLLLDPTEEKYPENDGQVKLLYVAATRALHELAVLYTGKLTGILAKKAPKGRHNQEFAMETLTKAKEYEKVSLTQKKAREENRAIGIQEMDERNSHGPKRIVIKPEQRPGMALGNTSTTGTAVMAKGSTATRRAAAETGEEIAAKTKNIDASENFIEFDKENVEEPCDKVLETVAITKALVQSAYDNRDDSDYQKVNEENSEIYNEAYDDVISSVATLRARIR